jgi:hypothetical protein
MQHENKALKAAEEKLRAKVGPPPAAQQPQAKKAAPLLFDLVFNKDSEFREKVSKGRVAAVLLCPVPSLLRPVGRPWGGAQMTNRALLNVA